MAPAGKPTQGRSRLPLLVALMLVLGGLVLWDQRSRQEPSIVAARPAAKEAPRGAGAPRASDPAPSAKPLSKLTLSELHDTVRRPLFEKRRRPVEIPVKEAPKPPPPVAPRGPDPNALTLMGVLAGEQQSFALLKRNRSGQDVRAQEGDVVDGWTIARIEPQRVILQHGSTEIALQLFRKSTK